MELFDNADQPRNSNVLDSLGGSKYSLEQERSVISLQRLWFSSLLARLKITGAVWYNSKHRGSADKKKETWFDVLFRFLFFFRTVLGVVLSGTLCVNDIDLCTVIYRTSFVYQNAKVSRFTVILIWIGNEHFKQKSLYLVKLWNRVCVLKFVSTCLWVILASVISVI